MFYSLLILKTYLLGGVFEPNIPQVIPFRRGYTHQRTPGGKTGVELEVYNWIMCATRTLHTGSNTAVIDTEKALYQHY